MKQIRFKTMVLAAIATMAFSGCREYIDEGSRYTFTGHTVASFLEENEETFSSFIDILKRGERFNLMRAYGQYTCFAPTNEAFEKLPRGVLERIMGDKVASEGVRGRKMEGSAS